MKTIARFFWAHLLLAVATLAIAYALVGGWMFSIILIVLGGVWLAAQVRGAHGLGGFLLLLFLVAAAMNFWMGGPGWLLLFAVVTSLGAWDLNHFLQRLGEVDRVEFASGLGRSHLRRLALVEGIGLLAGLVALTVKIELQFGWVALLVLLVVFAISRVIAFVRHATE